ncbi:myosin-G heavy chain-like [Chrysoperla carnea]|uniref:myosin-G heavy chain-like n=1 Tax=Chrysoperla carnea TaxID=189513 RepID=UPI001D0673CA|nr:myosin-G heavy chain-like [Chrysoperla carnea]
MQEASQPEPKEWKGFLSSMFSSLFWLQENRLTPKNRCPKCNRPKVQTSPFEVRCNCSVLACKESSATPTKQYDDSQDDSSTSKSSINLVYKSSPITSKLSALCNDDSFMKLIIKESTTKCLPILHNTNHQESSFDDLNIPTCKDSVHICCHLHNDEMVLNTVENDDNTDDNASTDDNDAASNNEDGNDDESTDDSDDKCQANAESYTQTDIVKSGESSCDDSSSDEEKSSAMNLVLKDNSKKIIEILSSKSSTCSSCEHGVVEEYGNKSQQEFPNTPSMKCLSSVEQIKDDILLRSSILSSCCDRHNFSNENCSSQTDSITYSNNSLIPHPCGTPPEESSQPNITPPSTSNRSAILKPSRIPIHKSRLGSRRNSSRDVSSTATNLVSGSTVTKTVNYQQTLFNENKNIPKKLNRGGAVSTPPLTTNVYRSFHLPSQSKPKKASQSYYNVTSGNTGCNTCDEKNSKTINIHQNRHSDTKRRSSIPTFNQKQADNSKLIKSIHHHKDKTNSTNVQTNVDKSPYSKYYDIYPGSQQNNLNDTMIHLQRKPSICSSLLSTDNYMDDETILIIETLIPKDYHVLHHTDKETIINNHNINNHTFNTNNSRQSNDKISLRSQKVSRTYSIKSSKPSTPIETSKK